MQQFPKDFYSTLLKEHQLHLKNLQRTSQILSWSRVLMVLVFLFAIYGFLTINPWLYLILGTCAFISTILLIVYHQKVNDKIRIHAATIQVASEELLYLSGENTPFPNGIEYAAPQHLYTSDLNIFGDFSLFRHMNRCPTKESEKMLANQLAHSNGQDILQKQEAVKELSKLNHFCLEFQKQRILHQPIVEIKEKIDEWLGHDTQPSWMFNPILLYTLSAFSIISLGYFLFQIPQYSFQENLNHFYVFLFFFAINVVLSQKAMASVEKFIKSMNSVQDTLGVYVDLLGHIEKIPFSSTLLSGLKSEITQKENLASKELATLKYLCTQYSTKENPLGSTVFNGLFMFYPHIFNQLHNWKQRHNLHLRSWLEVTNKIGMYVSMGIYSFHHSTYTYPKVCNTAEFNIENAFHPLLPQEKSIPNSISIPPGNIVILTGSNMSGKSTFLRMLGINMVLMKIGCPVAATSMEAYPFIIATSMNISDKLSENTSFFLSEITRLQSINKCIEKEPYTFLLLDEILRGTNSNDKREGTIRYLQELKQKNVSGVIATHDVEVAKYSENDEKSTNYFFQSELIDDELSFDYTLRKGICHSPNASILLQKKGIISRKKQSHEHEEKL